MVEALSGVAPKASQELFEAAREAVGLSRSGVTSWGAPLLGPGSSGSQLTAGHSLEHRRPVSVPHRRETPQS